MPVLLYSSRELKFMSGTLFDYFDFAVSNLQELEPAEFKFYKNWSLHHSKSKGLEELQVES